MQRMLITLIILILGFIFAEDLAWGEKQKSNELYPSVMVNVKDPIVSAKLDSLILRFEELRSETLENRKALEHIQGDVNIGKGMMIAVGAMGFMTFINMILGLVGCRAIRK